MAPGATPTIRAHSAAHHPVAHHPISHSGLACARLLAGRHGLRSLCRVVSGVVIGARCRGLREREATAHDRRENSGRQKDPFHRRLLDLRVEPPGLRAATLVPRHKYSLVRASNAIRAFHARTLAAAQSLRRAGPTIRAGETRGRPCQDFWKAMTKTVAHRLRTGDMNGGLVDGIGKSRPPARETLPTRSDPR